MSRLIVELNDSNIVVATAKEIITQSPGVAVLLADKIELGQNALSISHLYPQNTYTRFWSELNQDNLKSPSQLARHHADLAFAHMNLLYEQAGMPAEMVFAVPGSFSNAQLSLLAGLIEASPFTVSSMLESAVAAVASQPISGHCQHIDIALHQTIITTLEVTEVVRQINVDVLDNIGLTSVYDKCANLIADLFIEQSRFDPLRHAETEQALYDQLPHCLASLKNKNEVLLEIHYEQTRYQAKLKKDLLIQSLEAIRNKIIASVNDNSITVLSHRLCSLPGLNKQLNNSISLDSHAVFRGTMLFPLPASNDDGLNFISEIKVRHTNKHAVISAAPAAAEQATENTDSQTAATHLLINNTAYTVTTQPLYLGTDSLPLSDENNHSPCSFHLQQGKLMLDCRTAANIQLNGQNFSGQHELHIGDSIGSTLANNIIAIRVVDGHEQA